MAILYSTHAHHDKCSYSIIKCYNIIDYIYFESYTFFVKYKIKPFKQKETEGREREGGRKERREEGREEHGSDYISETPHFSPHPQKLSKEVTTWLRVLHVRNFMEQKEKEKKKETSWNTGKTQNIRAVLEKNNQKDLNTLAKSWGLEGFLGKGAWIQLPWKSSVLILW